MKKHIAKNVRLNWNSFCADFCKKNGANAPLKNKLE